MIEMDPKMAKDLVFEMNASEERALRLLQEVNVQFLKRELSHRVRE